MKRLICLLLALCLPACALAENLRARTGAPEHIIETLWSKTGRTEITIDADILVPEVSAVPLWEVTSTYFTFEEVMEAARLLAPEADVEQQMHTGFLDIILKLVPGDYSTVQWERETFAAMDLGAEVVGVRQLSGTAHYYHSDAQQVYYSAWMYIQNHRLGVLGGDDWSFDIDGEGIPGHALTTREAIAKADAFVAELMPGFALRWAGRTPGVTMPAAAFVNGADFDTSSIPKSVPDHYKLAYTRVVSGIPVNWMFYSPLDRELYEAYGFPPGYESMIIVVDDVGEIAQISATAPYTVGNMAAEDCGLLSFEQIWNIFREIAPLSVMYQESEGEVRASVSRIELGYMPVRQQDGGYLLTPVWDFYGTTTRHGRVFDCQGNVLLTIDATTGLVIDRAYGY